MTGKGQRKRMRRAHEELLPFKKGRALIKEVYSVTGNLPKSEWYGLRSQMRRAAVSYVSNIAEGAARGSKADFLRFLYMSRGSLSELAAQLDVCVDLGLLSAPDADELHNTIDNTFYFLHKLISSLKNRTKT